MNSEQLEWFTNEIMSMLARAAEDAKTPALEEPDFQYKGSDGAESEGTDHNTRLVQTRTQARGRLQMELCMAALQRIDSGEYGICASPTCGDDIPIGRLLANATAPFCADCQEKIDARHGRMRLPKTCTNHGISFVFER